MRYDFSKMDADSFEFMVRSLNEKIFGIKCEQYGLGPDGQREFTFEGEVEDSSGTRFCGKTIGQVKYKYIVTKENDYEWLRKEIDGELKRFREKEAEYLPDNYIFYTNVVLTPKKDTGVKDKINQYLKEHNDIIPNFYIRGYDEICALLDNNRDVATTYASHILPGDLLMAVLAEYQDKENYLPMLKRYLAFEFQEELYTRMEQAGSLTERKISIERVCVDIDVLDCEENETVKFAEYITRLGNRILGYRKPVKALEEEMEKLDKDENFVLIGGPGRGKTTICQFIAQIYRAHYLYQNGCRDSDVKKFVKEIESEYQYEINCSRIPFKFVLREYAAWMKRKESGDNVSVLAYMQYRIKGVEGTEPSVSMMRAMLGQLAWIFFFDGLDEVPETSNRKEVLKQINHFITLELREDKCDCIVIGTTRAQGYNNDFGKERYRHMEVSELSKKDCIRYIKKLFEVMEDQREKRREYMELMEEAMKDETIARLMKTPLQATIISILVKSGGKPPHERYSLFSQYYDIMVRREKQKKVIATLNEKTEWLEEIHLLTASKLQEESEKERNPSAEISRENLEELLKNYIEKNQDEFYEAQEPLEQRVQEFLMVITQRLCFLCENRAGYYSYSIRTMQEYFAGTYLVKKFSEADALKNLKRICYSSYWRNVLLFSFGYIEVQRESMEQEIWHICEEMNGKDNIFQEDYTANNICLFGTWLALDILIEDMFRGNVQNKYIMLAAEALKIPDIWDFGKFRLISGVQCLKLLHHIKEQYADMVQYRENIIGLLTELNENEKNDLDEEIIGYLNTFPEDEKIHYIIQELEHGSGMKSQNREILRNDLIAYIEAGKLETYIPGHVWQEIVENHKGEMSVALKRELFLQVVFRDRFEDEDKYEFLPEPEYVLLKKAFPYLVPERTRDRTENRVRVSGSFEYGLIDENADEMLLSEISAELAEMGLEYLSALCELQREPTLSKYNGLCDRLRQEAPYIRTEYKRTLDYLIPDRHYEDEAEFQHMLEQLQIDKADFKDKDIEKLMVKETDIRIGYTASRNNYVFDELFECGVVSLEGLLQMNRRFLGSFLFAAGVQMSGIEAEAEMEEETADRLIQILAAANQKNMYKYRMEGILTMLLASGYKNKLFQTLPDISFLDTIIKGKIMDRTRLFGEPLRYLSSERVEAAVSNIIGKVCYDEKESNYLALIPLIIAEKTDIHRCISAHDMKKLERIPYQQPANELAMKLLKLCMEETKEPKFLLDEILACDLQLKIIYEELGIILYHCNVANKEEIWALMYRHLMEEEFEGSREIQATVREEMQNMKCSRMSG